jgi:hypothetical protein
VTTIHARSGTWYDPEIASVLVALCSNGLLRELEADDLESATRELEPSWLVRLADDEDADRVETALALAGAV